MTLWFLILISNISLCTNAIFIENHECYMKEIVNGEFTKTLTLQCINTTSSSYVVISKVHFLSNSVFNCQKRIKYFIAILFYGPNIMVACISANFHKYVFLSRKLGEMSKKCVRCRIYYSNLNVKYFKVVILLASTHLRISINSSNTYHVWM